MLSDIIYRVSHPRYGNHLGPSWNGNHTLDDEHLGYGNCPWNAKHPRNGEYHPGNGDLHGNGDHSWDNDHTVDDWMATILGSVTILRSETILAHGTVSILGPETIQGRVTKNIKKQAHVNCA